MQRRADSMKNKFDDVDDASILALSALCNSAADHVAKARMALFIEDADADKAMSYLDEAIGCLKTLVRDSKAILGEDLAADETELRHSA